MVTPPRSERFPRCSLALGIPSAIGAVVVTLFLAPPLAAQNAVPSTSEVRKACAEAPYDDCVAEAARVFAHTSSNATAYKVAARSVRKACEAGFGAACAQYGALGDQPKDRTLAALRRGVDLGDATSMYLLGDRNLNEPNADPSPAIALLETACTRGVALACVRGQAAVSARGGAPHPAFDRALCDSPSGEGRGDACERVGLSARAKGAETSESIRYLERACLLGTASACEPAIAALTRASADARRLAALVDAACHEKAPAHCLAAGERAENGSGMDVDFARAASLYARACSDRSPSGCAALARLCGRGSLGACVALASSCDRGTKSACESIPNGTSR